MPTSNDELEIRLKALEQELQKLREEAKAREITQLKWGVRALGLLVITMGGWIWSQIGHLFELGGPR